MANFKHGKDTVLKIDDVGGTLRDFSSVGTDTSWDCMDRDLHDVTVFGAPGHQHFPGLANGTVTTTFLFDATFHGYLAALALGQTSTATIEFSPFGTAGGAVKLSGEFWLKSYKPSAQSTDMVKMVAEWQLHGIAAAGAH